MPQHDDRPAPCSPARQYSYLGPAGTFTEAALAQVPEAQGARWRAVNNIGEALDDVQDGTSLAAMMAIENTVEGGVAAVLDALATIPGLRIVGEYLVPVHFGLVARPGTTLAAVRTLVAHPVAYAQCRRWLHAQLPSHAHIPASSNVQAAEFLLGADGRLAEAAIAPLSVLARLPLEALAADIGDNPNAVTRFVLVAKAGILPLPAATGADKTSLVADLPSDRPGALLELLQQFATRSVNLSLLHSRPIGDELGRYRFVIDADGHIADEAVADALLGVRRFSPRVLFLGSYPRADGKPVERAGTHDDVSYVAARSWLHALRSGEA